MRKTLLLVVSCIWALAGSPASFGANAAATKSRTTEAKPKASAKVDINHADAAALEALPGVGPVTAEAIIAARPFSSVDDLERVPGIGPAKLATLRDQVVVRSDNSAKKSDRAVAKSKSGTTSSRTSADPRETSAGSRVTGKKVDVNTADAKTLEALPGVGPTIAQAIIAGRPYDKVEDLARVPGIGDKRLDDMRDQVTVSHRTAARSATDKERSLSPTGRINLNTASRAELEALPEIGPVKAQAIIDARPFSSIEDVMRVKGIKQGTFDVIKDQITVR